jgi:uncharacterized repeat protein (TIGR03803 family)
MINDKMGARVRAAFLGGALALGLAAPAAAADVSYTVVHDFVGDSVTGLTLGSDGAFYGTTVSGQIVSMTPQGDVTLLHAVAGDEGSQPNALVEASNGMFYGSLEFGGWKGAGSLFAVSPTGEFTPIRIFSQHDGANPAAPMIQASDGNLWGTTTRGCMNNLSGSVYRLRLDGHFRNMHCFNHNDHTFNGTQPGGALVQASDGFLYGTTQRTPNRYCLRGVCAKVFRMDLDGTVVAATQLRPEQGRKPVGALVQAADGQLYGVASEGGDLTTCGGVGCGTVFRVSPETMAPQLVHTFTGVDGDGAGPSNLVLGSNGMLYGRTAHGGTSSACDGGCGTLFRLSVPNRFHEDWQFETSQATPGPLLQGPGSTLYGASGSAVYEMEKVVP